MYRQPRGDYRPTRRKNSVPVGLFVDGEVVTATLLDISRDGAKLDVPFAILPGTAVELRIDKSVIPALVQWFKDQRVGLRFLDRLERDLLISLEGRDDAHGILG